MGMTIWRWSAGVTLGCAAIAALLLPFPATVPHWAAPPAPRPLAIEVGRLVTAASEAQSAVRSYRAAQALDRWTLAARTADTMLVRLDRSVPGSVAPLMREVVAEQLSTLGTTASGSHAEVFVYVDSTPLPRADDSSATRRALEPRRLVDVAFALPEATDGQRCVTLIRLRGVSPAHVRALRSQPLIGVCGFYAVFGLPGAPMREWLAATSYRFARRSDWSAPRAPAIDATSRYTLGEAAGRCLTGESIGCAEALRVGESSMTPARPPGDRLASVLDAALPSGPGAPTRTLGDAEGQLLADAVRAVGPERFVRFWQSGSTPQAAFVSVSGVTLELWTQRWLARTYGAAPPPPAPGLRDMIWLVSVAPVLLVVAARPRHRVLAERMFAARA